MDRRIFLRTLAAGLAGAAIDPERLLWVPGKKTIFLPTQRQIDFLNDPKQIFLYGGARGGKSWAFYKKAWIHSRNYGSTREQIERLINDAANSVAHSQAKKA